MATHIRPASASPAKKSPAPINQISPVIADATSVPADGQTVVYLLNLCMGSHVTIDGPERDAFDVTDEAVGLAFGIAGRYTVTVQAPGQAPARLEIRALNSPKILSPAQHGMPRRK